MNRPRAPSTASHHRYDQLSSRGAGSIADAANSAAWVSGLFAALVLMLGFSIYMLHRNAPMSFISLCTRSKVAKSYETPTAEQPRLLDMTSEPVRASQHTSLSFQKKESSASTSFVPDLQYCCICAELLQKRETLRQLPCGHGFHHSCIDAWLAKRSGNCPLW
jgi:hypothetical protein